MPQESDISERSSPLEKVKEFEEELQNTKYNKRTQRHIGLVKAKIAKLKAKQEARVRGKKKGEGYSVRKSGDATVALLGFPSVGKSTLLNALTNAQSAVGAYDFTTLKVVPGLLEYNHAKIQILDVPGVIKGAADGSGRGKEVLQIIRNADLVLILVDVFHPEQYDVLLKEVWDSGVRINQKKPYIRIKKMPRGGIRIGKTVKLELQDETIEGILKEFRIANADVLIRDEINEDQLIDVIEGNKVYIPSLAIVTKIDIADDNSLGRIKQIKPDVFISAEKKIGIDILKQKLFEKLDFIRIYLKQAGKKADLDEPMIVKRGYTLRDLCSRLHQDFINKFKFARIWGKSAKFEGQIIRNLEHKLEDEDVVQLHIA